MSPKMLYSIAVLWYYFIHLFDYKLQFSSLGLSSIYGLSFFAPSFSFFIRRLHFRLHLPRPTDPYWALITIDGYRYNDNLCRVTLEQIRVKLWCFPVIFRFSGGPWINIVFEDFNVLVYTSRHFPAWLAAIRNNVVITVIDGETIRANKLHTKVLFSTIPETEGQLRTDDSMPSDETDDIRILVSAEQWHLTNYQRRIYAIGALEIDFQTALTDDSSPLTIAIENTSWIKLPHIVDGKHIMVKSTAWYIICAIACFPFDFARMIRDPKYVIDVHVTRSEVSFLDFHVRDAEVIQRALATLKLKYDELNHDNSNPLSSRAKDILSDLIDPL